VVGAFTCRDLAVQLGESLHQFGGVLRDGSGPAIRCGDSDVEIAVQFREIGEASEKWWLFVARPRRCGNPRARCGGIRSLKTAEHGQISRSESPE
jgi:hypothetical protein